MVPVIYTRCMVKLNRKTFQPEGDWIPVLALTNEHGWEIGENNDNTFLQPFTEGAVTKYNQKYYLQYGAPGTEFKVVGRRGLCRKPSAILWVPVPQSIFL
jgi:hypothetical protein